MVLKKYLESKIAAVPAPLQWVYDPCGLVKTEDVDGKLVVVGKSYEVLVVRPRELLRFRAEYELIRTASKPIVVLSNDFPIAIADIVAICRGGKKGNVIDCSPKAILESPAPYGTGKHWNSLVNDLGDEFPEMLDAINSLSEGQGKNLNPNFRDDAIRLLVAARLHEVIDSRLTGSVLEGSTSSADLLALAFLWERSAHGPALRKLWREYCEAQLTESHAVSERRYESDLYHDRSSSWLEALESSDAREQLRNYVCTTIALDRQGAKVDALRPGIIGPDADRTWTKRLRMSPAEILGLSAHLKHRHPNLLLELTSGYEQWLRANRAVLKQLLVALGIPPASNDAGVALRVAEREDTFGILFVAALRVLASSLCCDPSSVVLIGTKILQQMQSFGKSFEDSDRDAITAFEAISHIAHRLHTVAQKNFLSDAEIEYKPQLWLEVIYPRHLSDLELLCAKAKIANDNGRLVEPIDLQKMRDRCIQTLNEFNEVFCKLLVANYEAWATSPSSRPTFICDLIHKVLVPEFKAFVKSDGQDVFLIVFDGMRYDTWQELKPLIEECFKNRLTLHREECVLSILPSATQYARKAIFAGRMPAKWPRRENGVDPETSEIRLLKTELLRYNIPYVDRLPDTLVTGAESDMKEEVIQSLIEDKAQVIKPLIFNLADNKVHDEATDLKTLHDGIVAHFKNKIRPILNRINSNSLVIITSDHGFLDVWGTHKQVLPQFYGAIRWRYGALRREDSKLGFPDDVISFRSRDIGLNVEYTYRLESTREFGATEGEVSSGKPIAYPLYVFAKPTAILGRRKIEKGEDVEAILKEGEFIEGSSKLRYEHGGVSLQEMIVPLAVYVPGKKTGSPDLRVEPVVRKYVDGEPATLTLRISNFGNAPAEQVKVSVDGVEESQSLDKIGPVEQETLQLDFAFTPRKDSAKRSVAIVYWHGGQQAFETFEFDLVVEDPPGKVERKKLF